MPHVESLDHLLNRRILMASDPAHWWAVKTKAKRLLAVSPDPDKLAARILTVLATSEFMRQAA